MFKTIVVGTDGSSDAENAMRRAAEIAKCDPETIVHVVTAYRPLTDVQVQDIAQTLPEEFRPLLHSHYGAESILENARGIFRAAGVKVELYEFDGDPTDALLNAVDHHNADLIVVGSRGEGVAKRALHGSVSTKLIHHAPCTVLVVKDGN